MATSEPTDDPAKSSAYNHPPTDAEGNEASDKVFTAKEQLCECLYDTRYNSDNNPLHGKEIKENKFPVRIFWQNKEKFESMRRLDETVCFSNAFGDCSAFIGIGPGI